MVKVFASKALKDAMPEKELEALINDFTRYKKTGDPPDIFGRDVPYHRPTEVVQSGLRHLHLNEDTPWPIRMIQFNRTSDTFLVYCSGFRFPRYYALLAILNPGHTLSNNMDVMLALAELAERFRSKF